MDALGFYRSMKILEETMEMTNKILGKADSSKPNEPCITMTYIELEHINDVFYDYKHLMEVIMRNTKIPVTESKEPVNLPFK